MEESEKIFNSVFKVPFPPLLKERFSKATEKFSRNYTPSEITECQKAVEKISDLEALELASRHLKKLPFLVLKFRIIVFLAEGWPLTRKSYINDRDVFLLGWLVLFYCCLRTAIKFIKGIFLLAYLKI